MVDKPTKPTVPPAPDRTNPATFSGLADTFVDFFDPFATYLDGVADYVDQEAAALSATILVGDITLDPDKAGKFFIVNNEGDGLDFVDQVDPLTNANDLDAIADGSFAWETGAVPSNSPFDGYGHVSQITYDSQKTQLAWSGSEIATRVYDGATWSAWAEFATSAAGGILAIANGGTGADTAAGARTALAAAGSATTVSAGQGLTGGGSLAANRTLTLGTPSAITGTSTSSVSSTSHTHELDTVPVLKGGTGATTAADARTNLGIGEAIEAGAVGSYVFAHGPTSDVAFGATTAGSNLQPTSSAYKVADGSGGYADSFEFNLGSALSGTWRCMGTYDYLATEFTTDVTTVARGATLWLRIS